MQSGKWQRQMYKGIAIYSRKFRYTLVNPYKIRLLRRYHLGIGRCTYALKVIKRPVWTRNTGCNSHFRKLTWLGNSTDVATVNRNLLKLLTLVYRNLCWHNNFRRNIIYNFCLKSTFFAKTILCQANGGKRKVIVCLYLQMVKPCFISKLESMPKNSGKIGSTFCKIR